MGFIAPTKPPYDPVEWLKLPFDERSRLVCESWALQGYGTPVSAFLFYALKIALYVGGFVAWCSTSPSLHGLLEHRDVLLAPLAFQKAILWSMLFEILGLGCGSGPLTGRYFPPFGAFLHFLRPGTTKMPLFPNAPLVGGHRRSVIDVVLYAAILGFTVRALGAPTIDADLLLPIAILVPLAGLFDKTIFLAARGEHFWTTIVAFTFAPQWIAGAMAVQLALWFWAGVSKLNHHFPTVVCVMTSNGPFTRFAWLRKRMYRDYPTDLRPSRLATWIAHIGTALELGVPIAFLLTPLGTAPVIAILLMLMLHGYITSNVPMGVPLEWNVIVAYGGFALFWQHPNVSLGDLGSLPVAAFLIVMLVVIPLMGNLIPSRVSFLLSMRYYAGNWPYSIWLFRGNSIDKLDRLKKCADGPRLQLGKFYDEPTAIGLFGKVQGFRLMHLHGRALPVLIPKAVDDVRNYEWMDGEIVAGLALGWNFGDGHLHNEVLLRAIQSQCGFEPGELRCIFVESQPLHDPTLAYRIVDAATGSIESGKLAIRELRKTQPWSDRANGFETGNHLEAHQPD
jgi:hypothetical protein